MRARKTPAVRTTLDTGYTNRAKGRQVRKILSGQGFTLGLVVVLALAYWLPEHGLKGGTLRTEFTTMVAVVAIFFLQGLNLSGTALRRGVTTWRLHAFTLLFGFVFLPLATWFCVGRGWVPEAVVPGLIFLAILPTTISTSVVYSSASGGDAAAATFGAALSNLLGIFAVPAWSALLIFPRLTPMVDGVSEGAFLAHFLWRLFWLIAVPLIAGLFGRRFLLHLVEGNEAWLRNACFGCVLFIAYAGFCQGFAGGSALLAGDGASVLVDNRLLGIFQPRVCCGAEVFSIQLAAGHHRFFRHHPEVARGGIADGLSALRTRSSATVRHSFAPHDLSSVAAFSGGGSLLALEKIIGANEMKMVFFVEHWELTLD